VKCKEIVSVVKKVVKNVKIETKLRVVS